ncbi:MAG: GNAT family N-acetyltransferase [Candidatus Gracilibacteria bacterium]
MYQYKVVSASALKKWSKHLKIFYKKYYDKTYPAVFKNTAFIGICTKNKEIIGAIRVVGDLKRFALLVDLKVNAKYQNQGVATTLMKTLLEKLVSLKIDHINLVVSQNPKWLKKFYEELGFIEVADSIFLQFAPQNLPSIKTSDTISTRVKSGFKI